jgi:hypothetical protein
VNTIAGRSELSYGTDFDLDIPSSCTTVAREYDVALDRFDPRICVGIVVII